MDRHRVRNNQREPGAVLAVVGSEPQPRRIELPVGHWRDGDQSVDLLAELIQRHLAGLIPVLPAVVRRDRALGTLEGHEHDIWQAVRPRKRAVYDADVREEPHGAVHQAAQDVQVAAQHHRREEPQQHHVRDAPTALGVQLPYPGTRVQAADREDRVLGEIAVPLHLLEVVFVDLPVPRKEMYASPVVGNLVVLELAKPGRSATLQELEVSRGVVARLHALEQPPETLLLSACLPVVHFELDDVPLVHHRVTRRRPELPGGGGDEAAAPQRPSS